jgi:hypothetical protein
MRSLELRLAAVKKPTAILIAQLSELIRLRDRLRKAELARRSPPIGADKNTRRYHQEACTSLAAPALTRIRKAGAIDAKN